jgi:hypothetical protein
VPCLKGIGKKVIFVTNNASKSRRMYKSTFDKLGIEVKEVGHWNRLTGVCGDKERAELTL